MKFKHLLIATTLTPLALQANFTGFYGGLHAGLQTGKARINSNYDAPFGAVGAHHSSRHSLEGFIGGAHLGYGQQFESNLYLGLELGGRFHGTQNHEDRVINAGAFGIGTTQKITVKNQGSLDLSVKAGYVFDRFLPYIKAGFEVSRYKVDFGGVSGSLQPSSSSKVLKGFKTGLGFDYKMTENWIFGFEYAHTFYGSFSGSQGDNNGINPAIHNVKPNSGSALLKISYKF